jgi:pilus assembly protein CpaC
MRHLLFLPLCLALLASPGFAAGAPAPDRTLRISTASGAVAKRVVVPMGKTLIVELDAAARDVLVTNPDIVDAVVKTPKRIYLMGKKMGATDAAFFDASGRKMLSLDIRVEPDAGDLAALINGELPGAAVTAKALNGAVVLSGTAKDARQASLAQNLAEQFTGDGKKIVSLIQVASGEQVMLKVRIAEVQREVSKQLGIDLSQAATTIGGTVLSGSTSNPYGIVGSALSDLSKVSIKNGNLSGTLKALETVGFLHTLAEPNLIAVSGETAKFLAGGEFPVPASRDRDGNVTVIFKQFGVGLSFTPVVVAPGRISLQLSTEVSELSNTGAYTMTTTSSTDASASTSMTIPALNVRRTETTVELPSGGSFAIAGLMQHTTKQQIDGFPGLKDLPILGTLFRSRDFQNSETELVVIVTAYLVHPVAETKLAAPTDGIVLPTEPEALFLGRLNGLYKRGETPFKPKDGGAVGPIVE